MNKPNSILIIIMKQLKIPQFNTENQKQLHLKITDACQ